MNKQANKDDIAKRQVFYRTPCFRRTARAFLAAAVDQPNDPWADMTRFLQSPAFAQYCQLSWEVPGCRRSTIMEQVSFVSRAHYLGLPAPPPPHDPREQHATNNDADNDDALTRRFCQCLRDDAASLQQQEQEDVIICFHGTRADDAGIRNILQHGLNPLLRHRQARGPGEYFSEYTASYYNTSHDNQHM